MKFNIYFLIGFFVISLTSCENEDKFLVEKETNLSFDIVMTTVAAKAVKSETQATQVFPFSGESFYKGTRITNFENRLYRIEDVKPHKVSFLSIPGIDESHDFQTLNLEWGYKSASDADYTMQESIDLLQFNHVIEKGVYKIILDNALVKIINNLDSNPDNSILVLITGTSGLNFNSTAKLEIPVMVKSTAVSIRYELF